LATTAPSGTTSERTKERPVLPPNGGFGLISNSALAELPALGIAPPPWRQPPSSLAVDLGFHLVYGLATAAAFEALTA
jgi:hypothetical protein